MISGTDTGKNVIAENEGCSKNKSDIGIWTEKLEEDSGRVQYKVADNWEGS